MGHTHDHAATDTYYLEQLCTIGFCGALGVVQILLWCYTPQDPQKHDGLDLILDRKFHIPVLLSGIALSAIAFLRAVSLWISAGRSHTHVHDHSHAHDHDHDHEHKACGHTHDHHHHHHHHEETGIVAGAPLPLASTHTHEHHHHHDHTCDHDHDHEHGHGCDHDHEHSHGHADCGHDHGWAPWRYIVLLLPLLLFLIGLPSRGADVVEEELPPGVQLAQFNDIYKAAFDEYGQRVWKDSNGKPLLVRVRGMYRPGKRDSEFNLFRLKMTCCAADGYPVSILVSLPQKDKAKPETLPIYQTGQWINVIGEVHFREVPGRNEMITVLEMRSVDDVKPTSPDPNPFLPN